MSNLTLNVPKNSTLQFDCTVSGIDSLTGYTGTLTVKEYFGATDNKIQVEHDSKTDNVLTFVVSHSSNNITAKNYVFGISITDGTYRYVIDLGDGSVPQTVGVYNVLPTV